MPGCATPKRHVKGINWVHARTFRGHHHRRRRRLPRLRPRPALRGGRRPVPPAAPVVGRVPPAFRGREADRQAQAPGAQRPAHRGLPRRPGRDPGRVSPAHVVECGRLPVGGGGPGRPGEEGRRPRRRRLRQGQEAQAPAQGARGAVRRPRPRLRRHRHRGVAHPDGSVRLPPRFRRQRRQGDGRSRRLGRPQRRLRRPHRRVAGVPHRFWSAHRDEIDELAAGSRSSTSQTKRTDLPSAAPACSDVRGQWAADL